MNMALFEDILVIFVGKSSKTYHIEDLTGNFIGKSSNTVHFRDLNRGGLERNVASNKTHLDAQRYKAQAIAEDVNITGWIKRWKIWLTTTTRVSQHSCIQKIIASGKPT